MEKFAKTEKHSPINTEYNVKLLKIKRFVPPRDKNAVEHVASLMWRLCVI